jgi:hypothetical protein
MADSIAILDLVPEHLKPLSALEEKLLQDAPLGQVVSNFALDETFNVAGLGDEQAVRSELLAWLLTDPETRGRIHHKGVNLRGAKLVGTLDLADARVQQPLKLRECRIDEEIVLERGEFKHLDFSGSQTGPISANDVTVQYDVIFSDGFKCNECSAPIWC